MKQIPFSGDAQSEAPEPPKPRQGAPEGRIGIYDAHLRYRGHCGPKATAVTASRFGAHNAKLTKGPDGRTAWVGQRMPAEVSAAATVDTVSSKGTNPAIKPPQIGGGN